MATLMGSSGPMERRQHPRLEVNVPVTLVVSGGTAPLRGRIRDISQGGCFFSGDSSIRREGRLTMDFVVLPRSICNATGRVIRGDAEGGFAVEFGAINEALQKFVGELQGTSPAARAELLSRILDPEIHVA